MKTYDKITGIVGAVIFLFSLVLYSIENIWGVFNWVALLLD
jgi:hypothetical protein